MVTEYQIKTQMVDVGTPELISTLLREEVDGLVMWDPWITEWEQQYGWVSQLKEPFYSVLIVGEMWALGDLKDPRVPRLIALFKDAIQYIQAESDSIDAEVARLGDLVDRYRSTHSRTKSHLQNWRSQYPIGGSTRVNGIKKVCDTRIARFTQWLKNGNKDFPSWSSVKICGGCYWDVCRNQMLKSL